MNFDHMWAINHGHTDLVYVICHTLILSFFADAPLSRFWIIALPMMAIVIPLFLYADITRLAHSLKKRMIAKAAAQVSILFL
jgi:hypothetical protein